jgi:hypothetical protein
MRRLPFVLIVASLAVSTATGGSAQVPRQSAGWALEYRLSGGMALQDHLVTISQAGDVRAIDRRLGDDITARASADLVARLTRLLTDARDAKATRPMPDAISSAMRLTAGGRTREIEITPELEAAVDEAWSGALAHALLGSWSESAWKLCKPVPQLSEIDLPIDVLTFAADGTFTVTWRGGGARAYNRPGDSAPHTFVPDYSGRYAITSSTGAIRMTISNGLFVPRDFAGEGTFAVNDKQLTFSRVWFGTRQAKATPDICELTFTRR